MSYPTIARGQPIPYGYGAFDNFATRAALDAKHAAEKHHADDAEAFQRERAEAEASLARKFLLLCSLGDASAPATFVKGDFTASDLVYEAIGYPEFQSEAMQLLLTLWKTNPGVRSLLERAAVVWSQQNIGSELP